MSEEWTNPAPDPDTPVKQGDLLMRRDPSTGEVLQVCLVITADCDITQKKFGNQLAALLVISLREYICTSWAERRLALHLVKATKNVCDMLNRWNSARMGGAQSLLNPETVADWVRRDDGKTIAESLEVPSADQKKLIACVDTYRSAVLSMDATTTCALDKLVALKSSLENKRPESYLQELLGSVNRKELPADIFLLPVLPQLDQGPAVVLHRELVGVPLEKVCFRAVDASSKEHFLRIGRLDPTFKYAVSQSFGMLYSRIGLPSDHEQRCDSAIQSLIDTDWDKE